MQNRRLLILALPLSLLLLATSCTKVKKEYYPSGQLKSEIQYRFGKENGMAIYYNDGEKRPSLTMEMKNGKKHGKLHRYFFNGKVETEATFVNDVQEDIESIYDLSGIKLIETHYLHGVKNGPYTTWHERNMVKEKGSFKDGNFDGTWEYYDERGLMVGEGTFENGTGTITAYDQAGNLYRITHYVNNLKDGDDTFYTSNGEVDKVMTYDKDRVVKINNEPVSIDDSYEE